MGKLLCKVIPKKLGTCGFSSLKPLLEAPKNSKVQLRKKANCLDMDGFVLVRTTMFPSATSGLR